MIEELDLAIRALLKASMTELGAGSATGVLDAQIGFRPPDGEWRSEVGHVAPKKAINAYLADLRENRKLRSNERAEQAAAGIVQREPAPARVDCHYLISAWSGATDHKARTLEEHRVLGEALGVLLRAPSIAVAGAELPIAVAPPDGFPKLAEFWGTMGEAHRWKPVILLVVTVPVSLGLELAGAEVTTQIVEARQNGHADSSETAMQIAGVVTDNSYPTPVRVPRAWVQLEDSTGEPVAATRTNANGEFTFLALGAGSYRLRLRGEGHDERLVTNVTVPAPSGRYDLHFT